MLASGRGFHQYAVTSADGCTCGSMQAAGQDCAGGQQTCQRASCINSCKLFQLFGLSLLATVSCNQLSRINSVRPCAIDTEG